VGDLLLACVEWPGGEPWIELTGGRRCELHPGDRLAVVLGNHHAAQRFEGYAEIGAGRCDLLSPGACVGWSAASTPRPLSLFD